MKLAVAILPQQQPFQAKIHLLLILVVDVGYRTVGHTSAQEREKTKPGAGDVVVGTRGSRAGAMAVVGEMVERPAAIGALVRGQEYEAARHRCFRHGVAAVSQQLPMGGTAQSIPESLGWICPG